VRVLRKFVFNQPSSASRRHGTGSWKAMRAK